MSVDFPQQPNWTGLVSEMELVSPTHGSGGGNTPTHSISADGPSLWTPTSSVSGIFKFNDPSTSNQNTHELIDQWDQCVRHLSVSSHEDLAHRLIDGTNSYWQSCGFQGKVFIKNIL